MFPQEFSQRNRNNVEEQNRSSKFYFFLHTKKQFYFFMCFTSLGLITACYQIMPPADIFSFSNYHSNITENLLSIFVWNSKYAANLRDAFTLGFIGLIRPGPDYWDGGLMYSRFFHHAIFPLILMLQIYKSLVYPHTCHLCFSIYGIPLKS